MKKLKKSSESYVAWVIPLYIFTIIFVFAPLVYMIVLSFMSLGEGRDINAEFTLENYINIFNPIYLETFWESIKLAFISTFFVGIIGYPMGYFMSRLSDKWKNITMMMIMIPFWTSSLIRLYGWIVIFRSNGTLDSALMWLGITDEPLKMLYTYPAVVTGMVYALLPFMIFSVYSSAEKLDWTLMEASRDLGASSAKAFMTVAFKLTLPGLLSGVILTFIPSMGLFFIADLLGGNKIVLVGTLIQEQLLTAHNTPFAAALSVALLILTSLMILGYKKLFGTSELEGI
ncbi:MAG: ABC transporter permease [Clostridia bacterium]